MSIKTWIQKNVLPTPEWKLNNEACAAHVAGVLNDPAAYELRAKIWRVNYPKMNAEIMRDHIRLELEREFWLRLRALRSFSN